MYIYIYIHLPSFTKRSPGPIHGKFPLRFLGLALPSRSGAPSSRTPRKSPPFFRRLVRTRWPLGALGALIGARHGCVLVEGAP